MPPKKAAEEKKQPLDGGGVEAELVALQGAKQDLELGQTILVDKLQQCKAENEQLVQQIEKLKARITNSTQDYVDILQHRGEQIKSADTRATSLQQQLERLQESLSQAAKEAAALKEVNASQAARLDDAAQLLADKDRMEETIKKQHALIEQRGQELKVLKAQLDGKDAALDKARADMEDLGLRCQSSTQLQVLFGEPWLVHIRHVKLKGTIPFDREYNSLSCTAGGKLVLCGGHSRMHESVGRETAVLHLDSLVWEMPEGAMQTRSLLGHSTSVVGRNKLLLFGGSHGEEASAVVQQLATDSMKWSSVSTSSASAPQPRLCHAAASLSDKVYVFGGMTIEGQLLADVWVLELDSMQSAKLQTFGTAPSARKGASLCAAQDGRRLYLFGGHDGNGPCNDCFYLEIEQMLWSSIQPAGTPPEPREGHMAAVLGRFMFVSGGCGAAAAGPPLAATTTSTSTAAAGAHSSSQGQLGTGGLLGQGQSSTAGTAQLSSTSTAAAAASSTGSMASSGGAAPGGSGGGTSTGGAASSAGAVGGGKRLTDTFVLDMYSGPCWEQLHDGSALSTMWLRQMSVSSAMHGNKLYTLQPNLHEQLSELQVMTLTLPEDIERLKSAKKRDQEQVDKLELLDCTTATSSSSSSSAICVSWRPPTKNNDRITGYKLMLSSSTGVVREVYQGKATQFTCTNLKSAAEYILSVKATYDDGSTLWSDSKAYHTSML